MKPLFYAEHNDALYLASEAKALFAMGVPAQWSAESMYAGGFVLPGDRTLFQGVHAVPPGHFLRATRESHRVHQYWDVDYPRDDAAAAPRSDAEYIAGFRDVLEESVKPRLRADVLVGCYLSGGIDSCAVLGLAARHHDGPVRAYTLTFDRAQYDEVRLPRRWRGMSARSTSRFRRDMLLHHSTGQDPREVERLLRELVENNQVSRGLLLPEGQGDDSGVCKNVLGCLPSWLEAMSGTANRMHGLMHDDFLAAHEGVDVVGSLLSSLDVERRLKGRNAVHSALYLWAKTLLPHYILSNLGDRMEMSHSVEGRVPFMDHNVAEYLHRVPVSMKSRRMTEKYILREAVKDVITPTVYNRQKHPFLSPPATTNQDQPLYTLMQDTLRGSAGKSVPFLDQKMVAALDGLRGADAGHNVVMDRVLTLALSFAFMHEGLGLAG